MRFFGFRNRRKNGKFVKPGYPAEFTSGNDPVTVVLTPEVAREAHDAAMYHGQHDVAALVEPFIVMGGKVTTTRAMRTMIRRMLQNPEAVRDMTSTERLAELDAMQGEFDAEETTDVRRIEILEKVREFAEEEMPESRCLNCKRGGIYAPYTHALIEGHCYSHDGMVDYTRITRMCEFCFDNLPHGEDDEAEFGLMVERKDAEARNDDFQPF